ncbi:hypothetical protein [Haloarcula salina]|uniref:Uncharacterized protein n=1 Tax=Haloarcula salina TaxID=1429914 RepID=A0AA41FZ63_9EURY|nr:hypothetical protein [Haloarcula salina]MBV0900481.1 hypothetical protein [Haloarcula salina]
MARTAAVVLALAIACAGCAGFVGEDVEPVTPAPVPTPGAAYPPGVTEDGVVAPALGSAHARTLAGQNYTVVHRQRVTDRNGTLLRRSNHTRWVARNATVYAGRFNQTSRAVRSRTARFDYWTNGSVVAVRYDERINRPQIVRWEVEGAGPVADLPDRRTIQGVAGAVDLSVAERRASGDVLLVGHRFVRPDRLVTPLFIDEPTNVSAQLRVGPDGTVEAMRLVFDAERGRESVRVTQDIRVRDIGSTTVPRPDWVANASQRSV